MIAQDTRVSVQRSHHALALLRGAVEPRSARGPEIAGQAQYGGVHAHLVAGRIKSRPQFNLGLKIRVSLKNRVRIRVGVRLGLVDTHFSKGGKNIRLERARERGGGERERERE